MDISRPEFFFAALIGFLIILFIFIARISDWATLASFYRFSGSFMGERWRFQSADLRWKMGYNNCLTIGANGSGLYLSVFFLFRLGHSNLFVPWADISVSIKRGFFHTLMEFRFRQAPTIPFRVSERLGQRIAKAAGSAWPGENETIKKDLEGGKNEYRYAHSRRSGA
jgi:hypothetical protein